MAEAVGILEVFGLATAFVAADAGCKAANVHLEVFDKNKPGCGSADEDKISNVISFVKRKFEIKRNSFEMGIYCKVLRRMIQ